MSKVELDENTKLPVRVVWAILSAIVGGAIWMTSAFIHLSMAQADIAAIRSDMNRIDIERNSQRDEYSRAIYEIKSDLRLIKTKLEIKD